MSKKKPCMREFSLPNGMTERNISHSQTKRLPSNMSTQFLGQNTDMECLVSKGLKDVAWFKNFLQNTSMPNVLDYAETKITGSKKLNADQKQELLDIIKQNDVRQFANR